MYKDSVPQKNQKLHIDISIISLLVRAALPKERLYFAKKHIIMKKERNRPGGESCVMNQRKDCH